MCQLAMQQIELYAPSPEKADQKEFFIVRISTGRGPIGGRCLDLLLGAEDARVLWAAQKAGYLGLRFSTEFSGEHRQCMPVEKLVLLSMLGETLPFTVGQIMRIAKI